MDRKLNEGWRETDGCDSLRDATVSAHGDVLPRGKKRRDGQLDARSVEKASVRLAAASLFAAWQKPPWHGRKGKRAGNIHFGEKPGSARSVQKLTYRTLTKTTCNLNKLNGIEQWNILSVLYGPRS